MLLSSILDKFKGGFNAVGSLTAMPLMLRYFLCLLCGMILTTALPPTYMVFSAFIGLSLFYILLASFTPKNAAMAGWLFGFGFFTIGLNWIGNAILVEGNGNALIYLLTITALPAALALFISAGAYTIRRLGTNLKTPQGFLFFAGIMTLTEFLRGTLFTGFPWNLYGTIWADNLSIMQFTSLGGIYSLTLLTLFWCSAIGYLVISNNKKISGIILLFCLLSFCLISGYGTNRISNAGTNTHPDLEIRIVQPNIAQKDKWDRGKIRENFNELIQLTHLKKTPHKDTTTVIVWPETAIHSNMIRRADYGSALRHALPSNSFLVTGILDREDLADGRERFNNSIAIFDQNLIRHDIYHKSHLVPFGEYIPLQKYIRLPFSPVANAPAFEGGNGPETLHDDGRLPPFSPLICYEIIFPANVISPDKNDRPEWIVNVANDGWYGDSAGPHQHLVSARFRAIEEGIPVIRAANTGISAVINAYGETLEQQPLSTRGTIESKLPLPAPERTLFSHFGNVIFFIFIAATFGCALILDIRSKASS